MPNNLMQGGGNPMVGLRTLGVTDPRTPLGKLRRRELYAYAKHFGVDYEPGEGAESVRQKLIKRGVMGTELPQGTQREMSVEKPEKPIEGMSMPQLRQFAKTMGIAQSPKDTKAVLLEKIRGQNPS